MFGRLAIRFSLQQLAAAAILLISAGLFIIGATATLVFMVAGLVLIGVGIGLMMPTLSSTLMRAVSQERLGRTMGGLTSALFFGQFLSPLVLQLAIGQSGISAAFLAAGACAFVACGFVPFVSSKT